MRDTKKRIIKILAGILAGVMLTGCAAAGEDAFDKIPAMSLSYGETVQTAAGEQGSWSYRVSGEQWKGYSADGLHPLQWDYEKYGVVLENRGGRITVAFTLKPEQVRVICWEYEPEQKFDETAIKQGTPVKVTEQDDAYSFAIPGDGTYIFGVYPVWEKEDCKGDGVFGILVQGEPNS